MSLLEVVAVVSAFPVGGSFIYACVRVGRVAGTWDERVSNLSDGLAKLTASVERFVEKADERLNDHAIAIARHAEQIAMLQRLRGDVNANGRRAEDQL